MACCSSKQTLRLAWVSFFKKQTNKKQKTKKETAKRAGVLFLVVKCCCRYHPSLAVGVVVGW
jgi:hypothetical protein